MNDTRGYGSKKKDSLCFWTVEQRHWTCGYRVAREKMWQDFAEFHRYNCCSLFIAAGNDEHTLQETHIAVSTRSHQFSYISIFYFMHIVIYQFGILRRTSPLCSNKKNIVCSNKSLRIVGIQFNKFQTSI